MPIRERVDTRDLMNWYVGVLIILQVAGLLLVTSALDHDPDPLMAWIQELPPGVRSLLSPVVIVAIPAIIMTIIVGLIIFGSLALVGVSLPFTSVYPIFY